MKIVKLLPWVAGAVVAWAFWPKSSGGSLPSKAPSIPQGAPTAPPPMAAGVTDTGWVYVLAWWWNGSAWVPGFPGTGATRPDYGWVTTAQALTLYKQPPPPYQYFAFWVPGMGAWIPEQNWIS